MPTGHKDPGTIASEIKMMRMGHAGAFLVVEGVADMRFWRPRRYEACELVNGEGKKNVIGGVQRLDAERFGGVLGVVDDDCDSLERCVARLPVVDPWRVVRGHDVVSILRLGLRRVLGDLQANVGDEQISRILRAGMASNDLQATNLWAHIRAWEGENHPFRILRG